MCVNCTLTLMPCTLRVGVCAGIGRPPGQMDVAGYVLQPFRAAERGEVDTAISEALRVIDAILALGLDKALSGQRL